MFLIIILFCILPGTDLKLFFLCYSQLVLSGNLTGDLGTWEKRITHDKKHFSYYYLFCHFFYVF